MKVLFVCRGNIGRSQMAAELFNLGGAGHAESAGTVVDPPNQRLGDRPGARNAIVVMKELGVDMSDNRSRQLTPELMSQFDKVVVMAEPESTPDWLKHDPKVEIWDVIDPKGQDLDFTRSVRDKIKLLQDNL